MPSPLCSAYKAALKDRPDGDSIVSINGSPSVFTLNPAIVKACPGIRVKVAFATYTAPGANPTTLTEYSQSSAILSAAHPHSTLQSVKAPLPGCRKNVWLYMLLPGDVSVPHQVPRSSDHISDPIRALGGVLLLAPTWGMPAC